MIVANVHKTMDNDSVVMTDMYYRHHFIYDEAFENKRFNRYVAKTKKYIEDHYLKLLYTDCFNDFKHMNFNKFMEGFIQAYYLTKKEHLVCEPPLFRAIHTYAIQNADMCAVDEKVLKAYLLNVYDSEYKKYCLSTVIEEEIRRVCKGAAGAYPLFSSAWQGRRQAPKAERRLRYTRRARSRQAGEYR